MQEHIHRALQRCSACVILLWIIIIALSQNKNERLWRERDVNEEKMVEDSSLGQLMLYLLGAHIQRVKAIRLAAEEPTPTVEVFMEGLRVSSVCPFI